MKMYHQNAAYNLYDMLLQRSRDPHGWSMLHLEHNLPRDAACAPWYEHVTDVIASGAFAGVEGAVFVFDDGDVVMLCRAPVEQVGKVLGGQAAELGKHALARLSGMMCSTRRGCYGYDLGKVMREAMLLVSVKRSKYARAHAVA